MTVKTLCTQAIIERDSSGNFIAVRYTMLCYKDGDTDSWPSQEIVVCHKKLGIYTVGQEYKLSIEIA